MCFVTSCDYLCVHCLSSFGSNSGVGVVLKRLCVCVCLCAAMAFAVLNSHPSGFAEGFEEVTLFQEKSEVYSKGLEHSDTEHGLVFDLQVRCILGSFAPSSVAKGLMTWHVHNL